MEPNRVEEEKHIHLHTAIKQGMAAIIGESHRILDRIKTGSCANGTPTGDTHPSPSLADFLSQAPSEVNIATDAAISCLRQIEAALFAIDIDKPGQ